MNVGAAATQFPLDPIEPKSKLPEFMTPVGEESSMYGVKLSDMDRQDLLKVIQWLVNENTELKKSEEAARNRLSKMIGQF